MTITELEATIVEAKQDLQVVEEELASFDAYLERLMLQRAEIASAVVWATNYLKDTELDLQDAKDEAAEEASVG